ncbi:MAG: DsbA family protein [Cyanobacteria bacterium CRU_2_1]|nr:DsbA family protein [Cyanobacteria bacterium CRU_2_1]
MNPVNGDDRLLVPHSERDHFQGSLEAPVVLVNYGDYQCFICGEVHRLIKAIQQPFAIGVAASEKTQLCLVFRHCPQTQLHPHAQKAAETAETAAAQGQFWQMHDVLFEHQQALQNGDLVKYANELGLDIPRFLRDIANRTYLNRVNEDIESGQRSGVASPPALFINGIRYRDAWDAESLQGAIVRLIK